MRRDSPRRKVHFLALGALMVVGTVGTATSPAPSEDEQLAEIARETYLFAYPIVLMDTTRRVTTNTETADPAKFRAPVNQFCHLPVFPDASFTDVVRPNAD